MWSMMRLVLMDVIMLNITDSVKTNNNNKDKRGNSSRFATVAAATSNLGNGSISRFGGHENVNGRVGATSWR